MAVVSYHYRRGVMATLRAAGEHTNRRHYRRANDAATAMPGLSLAALANQP